MNLAQRVVILIGLLAIAALALFPPWYAAYQGAVAEEREGDWAPANISSGYLSMGHRPLTAPPAPGPIEIKLGAPERGWQASVTASGVDMRRLLLEWIAVAAITGGLAVILGSRRKRQPSQ
jgi:hypothetical protein